MRHRYSPALPLLLLCMLASCGTPAVAGVVPVATGDAVSYASASATARPTATVTPRPPSTPEKVPTPQRPLNTPPLSCPVTPPPDPPFVPPARVTIWPGHVWYGTAALWTQVRHDGIWQGRPVLEGGVSEKLFWWREGYDWRGEPQPGLIVTGRRLDASATPLDASQATNAFNEADIGSAMLVGVTIPTPGCWEITGAYAGTTLSYVVWITP